MTGERDMGELQNNGIELDFIRVSQAENTHKYIRKQARHWASIDQLLLPTIGSSL